MFLSVLFVAFATALSAQNTPVDKQANSRQLIGERDKSKEDQIAKLFESIRIDGKLPPLTRIKHRDSLEQQVCTIAQAGALANQHSGDLYAIYKTSQPESISTELIRVASFNKQDSKKNPIYPRYSVAVWQVKDPQAGKAMYWVGVARYRSALEEFVDYHFTDDAFLHDGWKTKIAPKCRGK